MIMRLSLILSENAFGRDDWTEKAESLPQLETMVRELFKHLIDPNNHHASKRRRELVIRDASFCLFLSLALS